MIATHAGVQTAPSSLIFEVIWIDGPKQPLALMSHLQSRLNTSPPGLQFSLLILRI
jgi:hypothetical protein